jgi:hypothetical protein
MLKTTGIWDLFRPFHRISSFEFFNFHAWLFAREIIDPSIIGGMFNARTLGAL